MASQQLSRPEASTVQKGFNQGRVIASGSAVFNPQVDNKITISLKLKKKQMWEYPPSDFKLKIESRGKLNEKDMNGFVQAMPVNMPVDFVEVFFTTRVPNKGGYDELKFELVDQVLFPGDFLVCLAWSVKVDPGNSN